MKELCQSSSITVVTPWGGWGFDWLPGGLKTAYSYKLDDGATTFY